MLVYWRVSSCQGAVWVCLRWTLSASWAESKGFSAGKRVPHVACRYPRWASSVPNMMEAACYLIQLEVKILVAMCTFIYFYQDAVLHPKFFWVSRSIYLIWMVGRCWTVGPSPEIDDDLRQRFVFWCYCFVFVRVETWIQSLKLVFLSLLCGHVLSLSTGSLVGPVPSPPIKIVRWKLIPGWGRQAFALGISKGQAASSVDSLIEVCWVEKNRAIDGQKQQMTQRWENWGSSLQDLMIRMIHWGMMCRCGCLALRRRRTGTCIHGILSPITRRPGEWSTRPRTHWHSRKLTWILKIIV